MAIYQTGQTTGSQAGDIAAGYLVNGRYLNPGDTITPQSANPPPIASAPSQNFSDRNFLLGKSPGITPLTPENLNSTAPIPLTPSNPPPVYPVSNLPVPGIPSNATPQEIKANQTSQQLQEANQQLIGKSAYQTKENTLYGVDTAQQHIQDLTAQLTGIKNEAAAIPLQLQQGAADRGVTTYELGAQQNSRLRTNAIQALGVSTLLAASQGQLANAQSLADKAVAQKYDPILEQISVLQSNLQLILQDPLTSLEDKNRAQAQLDIQQQKADSVAQAKQNASDVWSVATAAASNVASFTPTALYPSASAALNAISQAPTPMAALQIAVDTGLSTSQSALSTSVVATNGHLYLIDDKTGNRIKDLGIANSQLSAGATGVDIGPTSGMLPQATGGLPGLEGGPQLVNGQIQPTINPNVQFGQYGTLAYTNFDPNTELDRNAYLYLKTFLSGKMPGNRDVGISLTGQAGAGKLAAAAKRAGDLYYASTLATTGHGEALTNPEIQLGNLALINTNNALANNLRIQEQTVTNNVDLSLQNLKQNNLNSAGFRPLDNLINTIQDAFNNPATAQLLAQNQTIQNELGSLLAVKNQGGTTVYDKLLSTGIINTTDDEATVKAKVGAILQEAANFSQAIKDQNAKLYAITDIFVQDPNNPLRNSGGKVGTYNGVKLPSSGGTNYNGINLPN